LDADSQDERYANAAGEFGGAIVRPARAYGLEAAARDDPVQDIRLALSAPPDHG
jgi:hypothetical protein